MCRCAAPAHEWRGPGGGLRARLGRPVVGLLRLGAEPPRRSAREGRQWPLPLLTSAIRQPHAMQGTSPTGCPFGRLRLAWRLVVGTRMPGSQARYRSVGRHGARQPLQSLGPSSPLHTRCSCSPPENRSSQEGRVHYRGAHAVSGPPPRRGRGPRKQWLAARRRAHSARRPATRTGACMHSQGQQERASGRMWAEQEAPATKVMSGVKTRGGREMQRERQKSGTASASRTRV